MSTNNFITNQIQYNLMISISFLAFLHVSSKFNDKPVENLNKRDEAKSKAKSKKSSNS